MGNFTLLLCSLLIGCAQIANRQTTPLPSLDAPAVALASDAPGQPAPSPYPPPNPQPPYQPPYQPPHQPPPYQPPYQPQQPPQEQLPPQPPPPVVPGRSHLHDGEVIGNFAAIGVLAGIDIILRQDVDNGGTGTMILLGSTFAGGAGGWLLTQQFEVDGGTAHATTLGLLVGAANGALLIEPTGWERPESVMGLLFFGSGIGAGLGFIYGMNADLTRGQATFVGNMTLLGTATAAFTAIAGSRDGEFGAWENGTLALGLDAGVVAGALIAPRLDWSARRSKIVFAATGVGALLGGMVAGLTTSKTNETADREESGDLVTTCMTAGMWGGFVIGILMTRDSTPDPRYLRPNGGGGGGVPTSYAPWIGRDGQLGVMAGGTW
ncbi:MAG: hypothetical protein JNL83_07910 [Myxococcales bacterium]|nr:hypothetical protein [Myxococcales bacterium]